MVFRQADVMMFIKKIVGKRGFTPAPTFYKSGAGFTLAEMMVTLVIFGAIFTMALINFRRGERLEAFRLATDQVAADIRLAQTSALTGISEDEALAQAYGLYFDLNQTGQYVFFKDEGDHLYGQGDQIIETMLLPEEIALSALTSDPLTLVFAPPKPTLYINGDVVLASAQISLERAYFAAKIGRVTVNRLTGQISSKLENQ